MNKSELVASVAEVAELTKKDAEKLLTLFLQVYKKLLLKMTKYKLLVLVLSKLELVQLVKVVTHRLAKLSKFLLPKTQYSKLVKL